MRFIRFALAALALIFAVPAHAQPTIHPGAQRLAHALLIESGTLEQVILAVGEQVAPRLRQSLTRHAWYATLDAQKKQAFDGFVDTFLDRITSAVIERAPMIETRLAIAYSGILTAEESTAAADYFGSDDGIAAMKAITDLSIADLAAGGSGAPADAALRLAPEHLASLAAFEATPGGIAFRRIGFERQSAMTSSAVTSAMSEVMPALTLELRVEACAIIGEPCPLR